MYKKICNPTQAQLPTGKQETWHDLIIYLILPAASSLKKKKKNVVHYPKSLIFHSENDVIDGISFLVGRPPIKI